MRELIIVIASLPSVLNLQTIFSNILLARKKNNELTKGRYWAGLCGTAGLSYLLGYLPLRIGVPVQEQLTPLLIQLPVNGSWQVAEDGSSTCALQCAPMREAWMKFLAPTFSWGAKK